jgi:hypothetical protein
MPSDVKKRVPRLGRWGNGCSLLAKRQDTRNPVSLLRIRSLQRGLRFRLGPAKDALAFRFHPTLQRYAEEGKIDSQSGKSLNPTACDPQLNVKD